MPTSKCLEGLDRAYLVAFFALRVHQFLVGRFWDLPFVEMLLCLATGQIGVLEPFLLLVPVIDWWELSWVEPCWIWYLYNSVYASQAGILMVESFLLCSGKWCQGCILKRSCWFVGTLNLGSDIDGFEGVHGGFGFWKWKVTRWDHFENCWTWWLQKNGSRGRGLRQITYGSGEYSSVVDCILSRKSERKMVNVDQHQCCC